MRVADYNDHICRQLTKMMDEASSWCGTAGELREMAPEYFVGAEEGVGELERQSVGAEPTTYAPRSSRSSRSRHSPRSKRS
jgi:hypothetical protein